MMFGKAAEREWVILTKAQSTAVAQHTAALILRGVVNWISVFIEPAVLSGIITAVTGFIFAADAPGTHCMQLPRRDQHPCKSIGLAKSNSITSLVSEDLLSI